MTAIVDDELWSAVGDPTRRRMLDLLLVDGIGTATSLSEQLPVTRQAVAKHLAVLEQQYREHGEGWAEPVEFLSHCSTKWAVFLLSLKALIETGTGSPSPDDVAISDWH